MRCALSEVQAAHAGGKPLQQLVQLQGRECCWTMGWQQTLMFLRLLHVCLMTLAIYLLLLCVPTCVRSFGWM